MKPSEYLENRIAQLKAEVKQLRAERDALLDLGDKAREWRAVRLQTATGFPWQDGVRTHNALAAAVDALEPSEGAQP